MLQDCNKNGATAPFKWMMSLPDSMALMNTTGQILCVNSAACRLLKTDESQLIEKFLFELTEDEPEVVKKFIVRWARSGSPVPASMKMHIPGGELLQCHIWGHIIDRRPGAEPDMILLRLKSKIETNTGFATLNNKINQLKKEINVRRQAEQALRKSQSHIAQINEELEMRVEQRTRQLKKTYQDLQDSFKKLQQAQEQLVEAEKMASLGNLVAGVAHEINTPVGVAVTASSFLNSRIAEYNDLFNNDQLTREDFQDLMSMGAESSEIILVNLQRAASLIQSFKQVAVDQSNEEKRNFNIKHYMEEILRSLRPRLKKTAITVSLNIVDDMLIYNTPGVFYQIITNLIMNSLIHAFAPEEQGEITISLEQLDEQQFILKYTDSGRGISEKNRKKIFEPFFSTNRHHGGSGLGMHIVYNLVTQKLGGKIRCQSELHKGIRFEIEFPGNAVD